MPLSKQLTPQEKAAVIDRACDRVRVILENADGFLITERFRGTRTLAFEIEVWREIGLASGGPLATPVFGPAREAS